MNKITGILYIAAVLCFVMFGIMTYKGYDKMTNYHNSEYSSRTKNAYVGGDAYNYIINGTYSTSFFVLATGFLISGVLCIIGGKLIDVIQFTLKDKTSYLNSGTYIKEDSLPPI